MHITLVNRWYPPHSGYGGVAVYNYYLAHALVKLGHRVTVVAARWSPDVPGLHKDNGVTVYRLLSQHRYRLHWLPIVGRYVRPLQQLLYSLQVDRKLQELEAQYRPDVIEFAEVNAEGFVYLLRRRHCPVVVRCHTPTFVLRRYYTPAEMPYDTSLTTMMEKFCIHHAHALTAPSHDMAEIIAKGCGISPERITVVPNALDVDEFCPASCKRNSDGNVVILHVGRVERGKGVQVLAETIPQVLRAVPQARFVFAGADRRLPDGRSQITALKDQFASLGLDSRVELRGRVSQAELLAAYASADICVVPSLIYESFSYTCAQAMACGLPVVASCIGGIPETVGDGITGILMEPGNVQGLAQAIICMAKDADLRQRMGQAGRIEAVQRFDALDIARQFLELIEPLAEVKRRG
jgi:glycogen(starch) synthase